jgi:shikimate kinase
MPGSGKTTIANFIAQNTNLNKIDLDKEIEKNNNLSILNIFKNKGESYFRKIESFMLNKIIKEKSNFILSTGGGTPCFNDNFKVISKNGISIFIDPPKSLLVERIKNSTNRPLFQNKKNIKKNIDELYELRKTIYKKSNYIITSNLKQETLSIIKLES